jgi:hypothetical protein
LGKRKNLEQYQCSTKFYFAIPQCKFITTYEVKMAKVKSVLLLASLLAVAIISSCSSPGGGANNDDNYGDKLSSSSSTFIPYSSSVVIPTQYYAIVMGNILNNSYCAYPSNWLGIVSPLTNELLEMTNVCLINSERYTNLTSAQVATYLSSNNLSMYTYDFDRKIAESPLNAALLVYTNTNNYLRLLIVGYQ